MAILDMLLSRRAKTTLREDIDRLNQIALREPERQSLSPGRAMLWETFCNQAADLVSQLFVENNDKQLDWGLKGHRRKLNQSRLAAVYWWMLRYQLVLFKNRGIDGYDPEDDFAKLSRAADDFIEHLVSSPEYEAVNPGPWEEGWRNQVSLEASLGLYNRVMELLGLHIDTEARISRVSLFTSATERAYDTDVKKFIQERNGTG